MDCQHNKTLKKTVRQDYFGLVFSTKMDVCRNCGAYLWTSESKQKFYVWLLEQKKNHRDIFVVQASLSDHSRKCLQEILNDYPGVPLATLIRAVTLVFLGVMEKSESASLLEQITERKIYSSFHHGDRTMTKIQFGPLGMLDIVSWSKIFQLKPAKIVEEAVYRMTSLYVENEPRLKEFWETQILPQISLILKSAS